MFQALRIETNREIDVLDQLLNQLLSVVTVNGIIGIITFHSVEDRHVKQFLKTHKEHFRSCSKKVIKPTQTEIKKNSRARSAKLRLFERIA